MIIRLENLRSIHNRDTGNLILEKVTEFVCGACRHLVNQTDKFCWQCGEMLEQTNKVEHYYRGEQFADKNFQEKILEKDKKNYNDK